MLRAFQANLKGGAMRVSCNFDGGNIEVVKAEDPGDIQLRIRKDGAADFRQWFYFRLTGAEGRDCALKILNGDEIAYEKGFDGYRAVWSEDRETWRRAVTEFDGKVMTIRHRPGADSVWFAYFAPYSLERHADFMAQCQHSPRARLEILGQTLDGRDIDLIRVGEPGPGKRVCWAIGRQHPGESMASWWMEGFLERLLAPNDAVSRALLEKAVFYVVPNANPDGCFRGHLRTNAAGRDLNREWANPTMEASPEIALIRARMEATGVDFCLDVHGDEEIPHNFIAGFEGIPSQTNAQTALLDEYKTTLARLSPDFQTVHGYGRPGPGGANLAMATNWIAERFGCLSMTLEMPFKDTADRPNDEFGWSPDGCKGLAHSCMDALYAVVDKLR